MIVIKANLEYVSSVLECYFTGYGAHVRFLVDKMLADAAAKMERDFLSG